MAIFNTYKSLDDITVKVFYDILRTQNYVLLYKNIFIQKIAVKSKYLQQKASYLFAEIYDSYCYKTEDNKTKNFFSLILELQYLNLRYKIITELMMSLNESNKKEIGKELQRWNIIFHCEKSVYSQKNQLKRQIKAARNKINRKDSELQDLLKKNENKSQSIFTEKVNLEKLIGISINIEKTTMTEWFELKDIAKEIIENKKRALKNG